MLLPFEIKKSYGRGMSQQHEDFIGKLRQIEESAFVAGSEAQVGSVKSHLRNIGLIARALRSRLEMGAAQVIATPAIKPTQDSNKDRAG